MKIKAGAKLYPIPTRPLVLGDQRLIKREFGVIPARDGFDFEDPDHLAAFLYAAMREEDREATSADLLKRINRVREMEFVDDEGNPLPETADEDEDGTDDEVDPTPPPSDPNPAAGE